MDKQAAIGDSVARKPRALRLQGYLSLLFRLCVAGALIYFVFTRVDLKQAGLILSDAKLAYVLAWFLLFFMGLWVKAYRWQTMIRAFGVHYPMKNAYLNSLRSFAYAMITPGKLGDFGRAYYPAAETQLSGEDSLSILIYEKLLDLSFVATLAVLGTLYILVVIAPSYLPLLGVLMLLLVLLAVPLIFDLDNLRGWLGPLLIRRVPFGDRIMGPLASLYRGFQVSRRNRSGLLVVLFCTCTYWLTNISQTYLLACAVGMDVSPLYFFLAIPIAIIIASVPISISGIGIREGTVFALFSLVGIPANEIVAYSILGYPCRYSMALLGYVIAEGITRGRSGKPATSTGLERRSRQEV